MDLRYGARQLIRHPGFAIAAILTIALGIGADTAIFSFADAVLFRPLPYPESDRLILVWDTLAKLNVHQMPISAEDFDAFRADTHIFESTAAFQQKDRNLIAAGNAEKVSAIASTPGMLKMLGADSMVGRSLTDDDGRPDRMHVAVISYSLCRRWFSEARTVLGKTVRLDDGVYTIVGVLPKDFEFSIAAGSVDIWTPLPPVVDYRMWQFAMLGRLRPGVDIRAAQKSIAARARQLELTTHPYQGPNGEDPGYTASVVSLHDHLLGKFRTGAMILMSTVALVLLIACVNVANLLIVRATARDKEIAMRRSLGATPLRLLRQWMTESALLALLGSGAGVLISVEGIHLLKILIPGDLPTVSKLAINGRGLLFACAASVLCCLIFGIAPLIATGYRSESLRGPARRSRASQAFVAAEVALALMLSVGAGLLLRTFEQLRTIDPGFRADHLLTLRITLSSALYKDPAKRVRFYSLLQDHLSQVPGVVSTSAVDRLPVFNVGADTRNGNPFSVDGHPFDPNNAAHQSAHTPSADGNYFRIMNIPLLAGRTFSSRDNAESPPVAVINQTLARTIFPTGDALGKRILFGPPHPNARWMTIVGIIGDIRTGALELPPWPQFYMPVSQEANTRMFLIVRTMIDPLQIVRTAADAVHQLDPEQPIDAVETMEHHISGTMAQPRFQASLVTFFAMAALLLAAIGIYGVVAHVVLQRTKELGIRMALGADRSDILMSVLRDGLKPVAIGLAIGLAGTLAFSRVLGNDPVIIGGAVVLLACVGAFACLIPAGRSTRVDPMIALRYE